MCGAGLGVGRGGRRAAPSVFVPGAPSQRLVGRESIWLEGLDCLLENFCSVEWKSEPSALTLPAWVTGSCRPPGRPHLGLGELP